MKTLAIAAAIAATLVSASVAQAGSAATQHYYAHSPYASSVSGWADDGTLYSGRSAATDNYSNDIPDSHIIGSGDRHGTASGGPVGGFKDQP